MRFAPVVLLCSILLAGCGKGGFSQRVKAEQENTYVYAISVNPTTLDPGIVQDMETSELLQNVYEGLVAWDDNNRIRPQLAESWTLENDGRTYVFKIRENAQFHNGKDVTAEDVKWTFERNCNPALKSPTAENYLGDIVGVSEVIAKRSRTISGIEVVDPKTVRITIDQPRPYFLGKLTYPTAYILDSKAANSSEIKSVDEANGTGPFKLIQHVSESLVTLAAYDDYYEGRPQIDRISRPVLKDASSRLNKFKNGELDWIGLEKQDVPGIRKDARFKDAIQFVPRASVAYLGLSGLNYAPFRDPRVRRAFAMGIDKDYLNGTVMQGLNLPANCILPPGVAGHRENAKGISFDPEGGKKLLAEAGFAGGKGMPPLDLVIRADKPDSRIVAEAVASQLKKNLGVEVKIRNMEWRSFLEARNGRKLSFYFLSWYADYLDPQNFLSLLFTSNAPLNAMGYSNPKVDDLCKTADSTLDEAKRMAMYAEAEDIILQDAPWIPLYFLRDAELVSPRVKGIRRNLVGVLPHTQVTLE